MNKLTIIFLIVFIILIIVAFLKREKLSELFKSATKKSAEICPEDPNKDNLDYFIKKTAELASPEIFMYTIFVGTKLYDPSNYNKKMNDYISDVNQNNVNKNEVKSVMKTAYDTIMNKLGPPKCILTQKQLTACKQVLDDINQKL